MAARRNTEQDNTEAHGALASLFENEATEYSPLDTRNIAAEMGVDADAARDILDSIADTTDLIDGERVGGAVVWWIKGVYASEADLLSAYDVASQGKTAKPTPKPAKAPSKAVTGTTRTQAIQSAKTVAAEKIVTPAVDAKPAAPVESETQTNKGDTMTTPNNVTTWENPEHPSKLDPNHESGQYIAPAEFIPAPPEGINSNKWELVFTAPTRSARAFWHAQCVADKAVWDADAPAREAAAKAAAEAEKLIAEAVPVVEPEPVRLCPMTGEPLPF